MYLAYPFVRYALIVGVLIAFCSSLLGVTLVLKRFSFIGDGLSHVAFGGIAIASVLMVIYVTIRFKRIGGLSAGMILVENGENVGVEYHVVAVHSGSGSLVHLACNFKSVAELERLDSVGGVVAEEACGLNAEVAELIEL